MARRSAGLVLLRRVLDATAHDDPFEYWSRDPDGDYPLSVVSVSGSGFSQVSNTTVRFSGWPAGTYVGSYTVQDSRGGQSSASITVIVTGAPECL